MFDNIEQLEKEIQEFRQNILASAGLIKSLDEIAAAVRKQQDEFGSSSTALLEKLEQSRTELKSQADTILAQIEAYTKSVPESVTTANADLIKQMQDTVAGYEQTLKSTVEQLKADNEAISEDTLKKYGEMNEAHIKQLEDTAAQMTEMVSKLETKYNQFLERLEATNVDSLFAEVQKMKKSLETKMLIILGGVGVTAVIALISLFIR